MVPGGIVGDGGKKDFKRVGIVFALFDARVVSEKSFTSEIVPNDDDHVTIRTRRGEEGVV